MIKLSFETIWLATQNPVTQSAPAKSELVAEVKAIPAIKGFV